MRLSSGFIISCALASASLASPLMLVAGCDDLGAGRPAEPTGGPRLERLLVQDAAFVGGPPAERAAAVDLLDKSAPTACSDVAPCSNQFLIAQNTPDLTCSAAGGAAGVCVDPLAVPPAGVPLNNGGNQIRVVFNKILSSDVETVAVDAHGAPTGSAPYQLKAGLVELLADGKPVDNAQFWDPTGTYDFTSDLILVPFGPALVIDATLAPKTTYTVRIHSSLLHDRQGEQIADASGKTLPDPADYTFTTEDIVANPGMSFPPMSTKKAASLLPNEILQFAFFAGIDETSVKLTMTGPAGFDAGAVEAYADRGDTATAAACGKALDPTLVDVVDTTGAGAARKPADWPAGNYTIALTATGAGGAGSYASPTYAFIVAGSDADAKADPDVNANHVIPEQCQ